MTSNRARTGMLVGFVLAAACSSGKDNDDGFAADGGVQTDGGSGGDGGSGTGADGAELPDGDIPLGGVDPKPAIHFTQVGTDVGIDRTNEPASAGPFDIGNDTRTPAYGSWLADLDGDSRLDYFGVNHGQTPHLSGLFMNTGLNGFGQNLFTVSFQPGRASRLDLANEVRFVGDITGDGRVDLYFISWTGGGEICVNQGVAVHADWTGPGYLCFGSTDGLAFADVNGDGKLDVLTFDFGNQEFDNYVAYYSQTATYQWRLNDGTPDVARWPVETDFLKLRVIDPAQVAAPFVDLNNDGVPDKIVGIPLPLGQRGQNATESSGQRVFLGQAANAGQPASYVEQTTTGLETARDPITRLEDVDGNGCIDVGTDNSGYRDNQTWYLQHKTGATCDVTFTRTPRTALPYYPGFKRYDVDIDNSGLLSKVVLIHSAYGNNDGRPTGASIYHKQPDGSYRVLTPDQSGVDITGPGGSEFYADNLSPGDWNDDGRLDLAGSGNPSIAGADKGFGLWTSELVTSNSWIKVTLPSVTGFFTGAATIEVFDAGAAGDPAHLVTPAKVIYTGKAWATQVYHFGIGTRTAVDVRVTFPDGRKVTRTDVAPASRLTIAPTGALRPAAAAAPLGSALPISSLRSSIH